MGTLKISGRIKLDQFWPSGKSDADTTKIHVVVDSDSFFYSKSEGGAFKPTKTFLNAKVKGSGKPVNVIKNKNRKTPTITIRLQGVDAPELHYKIYGAPPRKGLSQKEYENLKNANKEEYRQYFSETATMELSTMLSKYENKGFVDCTFISKNINKPSDVCDVYGRFVGDVYVNGEKVNVNHWLIENGWVFPSFYNSMSDAEIRKLTKLYNAGERISGRTIKNYSADLLKFNYKLLFRDKGKPNRNGDTGKVNLPKIFRRYCIYSIYKKAGINKRTFDQYLAAQDKTDKVVLIHELAEYRRTKKAKMSLSQIFKNDKLIKKPEDIIFIEKDSKIIDEENNEIKNF